ncbi:hypothetical protein OWM54_08325 [Myxococcus sp. MISCRS1]|jgi:hypothetical protein|uniref:hypothetical protein n=1 Tax=Myxococcus TaxID=32 RepID=UPI00226ECBED|nr:hypothetical protein [Myxococcus sp. MISCRS1]MCY0997149.1 hypothetical protein [Myxococcus sp. MISCRS1]
MKSTVLFKSVSGLFLVWALFVTMEARAETVVLTCVGAEVTEFEPGLTNDARPTHISALGTHGCAGLPLNLPSAIVTTEADGILSCGLGQAVSTIHIQWSDDTVSVVSGTTLVNAKPAGETVVVLTGTVVSGRFQGATVIRTLTLLNTDVLGCFTAQGVTDVAGPVTLVVTKLL